MPLLSSRRCSSHNDTIFVLFRALSGGNYIFLPGSTFQEGRPGFKTSEATESLCAVL